MEQFNYYNYFTEVEDQFVKRRGSHILVSPLDWALIETWKNNGIPLNVVLRGIDRAFDAYDARKVKHRKVNSIFYCQQEVEECFAEYKQSQVGAPAGESNGESAAEAPFPREAVLESLLGRYQELKRARENAALLGNTVLEETLERVMSRLTEIVTDIENAPTLNAEALEQDLSSLESLILEKLIAAAPEEQLSQVREEAKQQLKTYKKRMDKEIYRQTFDNYVAKRLLQIYLIPRLSLFYLL